MAVGASRPGPRAADPRVGPARVGRRRARPGVGDLAAELGGTIQAEITDEFLVGTALFRVGFSAMELRVYLPSGVLLGDDRPVQFGDLGVGVKVPLEVGGGAWRWAAVGVFTAPTGARGISAEDPGLSATLVGERSLSPSVGFALNAGYGFLFGDLGGGTVSLIATPTFAVPGREGLAAYAGYAGFLGDGDDAHYLELGLAGLDGVDRQWDVNAGYDPGGHVWFLGVGVAQRWR